MGHELCKNCLNALDPVTKVCRSCSAARSARWYSQNVSLASAQRGLRAKVNRRLDEHQREQLLRQLSEDQEGKCGCCGVEAELSVEWSLDQVADDGMPLCRGALCRRCKIAVNRVLHPSRFVLQPDRLAEVERYLRTPLRDPRELVSGAVRATTGPKVRGRSVSTTDELVDWVRSLALVTLD